MGSISKQHAIISLINYLYIDQKFCSYPFYIFGGGTQEKELLDLIKSNRLHKKIIYFGPKNSLFIKKFLKVHPDKFIGFAPYDSTTNDHVYFGDSLKIKEYLSYDIPFITSAVTYVAPELRQFGFTYKDFSELHSIFRALPGFKNNIYLNKQLLEPYLWSNIFSVLRLPK